MREEIRRERNRLHAKRTRARRRNEFKHLEQQITVLERDTRRLKDALQHRGAHAELAAALVDEDEEEEHTAQDCTDGDDAPQQQQKQLQQQQAKKQQQQPEKRQRSSSVHSDAAAVAVKEEVKAEPQEDCDGSDAPRGESPVKQQQQHPLAAALLPPTPLQYLPTRSREERHFERVAHRALLQPVQCLEPSSSSSACTNSSM
eukprot:14665-Heterococcus_DN1.PRE.1